MSRFLSILFRLKSCRLRKLLPFLKLQACLRKRWTPDFQRMKLRWPGPVWNVVCPYPGVQIGDRRVKISIATRPKKRLCDFFDSSFFSKAASSSLYGNLRRFSCWGRSSIFFAGEFHYALDPTTISNQRHGSYR